MANGSRISYQQALQINTSKVLSLQAALVSGLSLLVYFYAGSLAAQAVIFGGGIALMNTWIMGRRVRAAAEVAKISPGQEVVILYVGAAQRFVFTAVFFVLGMWWLKLPPPALLGGFALAQLAYLLGDGQKLKSPRTINS